jgi:uncharacterized protein
MNLPNFLNPNEQRAIEQAVRELVLKFPAQVRFIALFGSKARGDFTSDSDIDLLIISESDDWQIRHMLRDPVYDANLDHTVFIATWIVSWERFQHLPFQRPGLFNNLRQDALELWRRPGTDNPLKTPELTPAA